MPDLSLFEAMREETGRTGAAPCSLAIAMSRVPAKRWGTRSDIFDGVLAARAALERGLTDPICLDDLARIANMSKFHFLRAFKATYGTTPHDLLTRLRLDLARSLLVTSRMSVAEVCVEVGFRVRQPLADVSGRGSGWLQAESDTVRNIGQAWKRALPYNPTSALKGRGEFTMVLHGVCHVEFDSTDLERSKKFFGGLFDYNFRDFGSTMVVFGTDDGHVGGLNKVDNVRPGTSPSVWIRVASIDAMVSRVAGLGGSVVSEKSEVPTVGWSATVADPDGNRVGMVEYAG